MTPFLSDNNFWVEGTLKEAAQDACGGLCLHGDRRVNSQTLIFPLDETNTHQ